MAQITARSSLSVVLYLDSVSLRVLLALATGLSDPTGPWDNTATNATVEASVLKTKDFSKSGYCKRGAVAKNVKNY